MAACKETAGICCYLILRKSLRIETDWKEIVFIEGFIFLYEYLLCSFLLIWIIYFLNYLHQRIILQGIVTYPLLILHFNFVFKWNQYTCATKEANSSAISLTYVHALEIAIFLKQKKICILIVMVSLRVSWISREFCLIILLFLMFIR